MRTSLLLLLALCCCWTHGPAEADGELLGSVVPETSFIEEMVHGQDSERARFVELSKRLDPDKVTNGAYAEVSADIDELIALATKLGYQMNEQPLRRLQADLAVDLAVRRRERDRERGVVQQGPGETITHEGAVRKEAEPPSGASRNRGTRNS